MLSSFLVPSHSLSTFMICVCRFGSISGVSAVVRMAATAVGNCQWKENNDVTYRKNILNSESRLLKFRKVYYMFRHVFQCYIEQFNNFLS